MEADGAKACPVGGFFSLVRRNKLQKHFWVKKNLLHVGNTSFFVQKLMKSLDCVHAPSRTKFSVLNHNNIHHIRVDFLNSITSAQANFLKKQNVVPFMSLPNSLLHSGLEKMVVVGLQMCQQR